MTRCLPLLILFLLLPGCCMREREAIKPLADGVVVPYAELVDRVKLQAGVATEAFYVDDWPALKKVALALAQTARFFPRVPDPPPAFKKDLPARADELEKAALLLARDAQAKDISGANAQLQAINLKIREFHGAPVKQH